MDHKHTGACHCGSIEVELQTPRAPGEQLLGECQCSFCRKHNARAFSDVKSHVTLTARKPDNVQLYRFGYETADVVICRRCGVYVAMVIRTDHETRCTLNVDTLADRKHFSQAQPRVYDDETREGRIARRLARWTPTTLLGFPPIRMATK